MDGHMIDLAMEPRLYEDRTIGSSSGFILGAMGYIVQGLCLLDKTPSPYLSLHYPTLEACFYFGDIAYHQGPYNCASLAPCN